MTAELRSAWTGEGARPYVSIAVPTRTQPLHAIRALTDQGEEFGAGFLFAAETA